MRLNKFSLACLVLGGSALLTACGGGGSGGGSGGSIVGGDSALNIRGTAARGLPLVGTVTASCKAGTGTAVSNLDGSFSVVVNNGVGPCLLVITSAGGATLYSITSGSGASPTANITPMTNLLVGYLRYVPGMTAADPVAWFDLPVVKALLVNTPALTDRIVSGFVPALKTLLPTLSVTNTDFLFKPFVANPTISDTDADLEKLKTAEIVTSTGAPSAAATRSLAAAAANDAPVATPTGASGAGN